MIRSLSTAPISFVNASNQADHPDPEVYHSHPFLPLIDLPIFGVSEALAFDVACRDATGAQASDSVHITTCMCSRFTI